MAQGDIKRKTVLLTGPTSGIGAAMLATLLAHPRRPHLVLLGRDQAALASAVAAAEDRGLTASGIPVDLSDLASIRRAHELLHALLLEGVIAPIDVALLNAGAQFASRRQTGAQGHELTFTINVIAQHLLLRGLEPILAPSAHVILMGSSTHRGKRASFNLVPDPSWQVPSEMATPDPRGDGHVRSADERDRGGVAYGTSKLALVTLSHDWAEHLARGGRRLNVYDPGLVPGTGLGKDLPGAMYWVWKNLMPAMSLLPRASTPPITSRHAVALALGDTYPALHDGYVEIGKLTHAEKVTFDPHRRAQLSEWLESAVAAFLPDVAAAGWTEGHP